MGRGYSVQKCQNCRRRKVKCDGQKPCARCVASGVTCTGYGLVARFVQERQQRPAPPKQNTEKSISKVTTIVEPPQPFSVSTLMGTASQYTAAFIGGLPAHYVPSIRPCAAFHELDDNIFRPAEGNSLCKYYITQTCERAALEKTQVLENSLLALSLSAYAIQLQTPDLSIQAMRFYHHTLRQFRQQVTQLVSRQNLTEDVVLRLVGATLIASLYEVVANGSTHGFENHLRGAGLLLRRLGVDNLHDIMSWHILYDFRGFEYIRCLAHQEDTFLCEPQWKEPAWLDQYPYGRNSLQRLITIALDALPLWKTLNEMHQYRVDGNSPSEQCGYQETIENILSRSRELLADIQTWHNTFADVIKLSLTNEVLKMDELITSSLVACMAELYFTTTATSLLDLQLTALLKLKRIGVPYPEELQEIVREADMYAGLTVSYSCHAQKHKSTFTWIISGYTLRIASQHQALALVFR
ncbi:hypothetical protein F5884DRAFT_108606 [Xylogone sp. PMI_703]|nr:hypothetical protein F5884DRAFT_108606 [Xylogone sp. PMI_703]